jgi:hypothetical protein
MCRGRDKRGVIAVADRRAGDAEDVHVDGARRIVEQGGAGSDECDIELDNGHGGTLTIRPVGGRGLPCPPDASVAPESQSSRMITAYPLIWSADIVDPLYTVSDVNVLLRVTYNTLEAICRDAFVLTETQAVAATSARFFLSSSAS